MSAGSALLAGLLAGAAIAMQFGAVSALLVETAITAGPRAGAAGGVGVATVDLCFAALAVVAGGAARAALAGHEPELKAAAAVALAAIAARGLRSALQHPPDRAGSGAGPRSRAYGSPPTQYVRFVVMTMINPLTIVSFASVAASLSLTGFSTRVVFVTGVGAASALWHLLLTLAAGHAGRRITPALQRAVTVTGRLVVLAVAVRLACAA